MNPLKTVAIKNFLKSKTHADLAALYNENMEVQVNVAQDGGERVEGNYEGKRWLGWSDGIQTWKPIRIPIHANTDPIYTDSPMNYDMDEHAEGVGMTGWDWRNRKSCWVAFDFDAITGHSDKHKKKLTDLDLIEIKKEVYKIPWTTLRLSTSGKGLHLYVYLDPIPTQNHTEHAAVARSVLHLLSGVTGFDFNSKVDVCGGNMWVWHRKMLGTSGLTLDKSGTRLTEVPTNWRDHLGVTTGKTRRNLPSFVESLDIPDADRVFEELTGQRSRVKLDSTHKAMMEYLTESKAFWWWDADHHMIVTHTYHLKECHEHFGYKGTFETIAVGANRGNDHNCFGFPLLNGTWAIRRYTPGTAEFKTWDQDGKGWTRCYLNREIDLDTAARTEDAVEHPKGGWHFREATKAQEALRKLGAEIKLPVWILNRSTIVKKHPKEDAKIIIEIPSQESDRSDDMEGWLKERGRWVRVFIVNLIRVSEPDVGIVSDEVIRHLVNVDGVDQGWIVKADSRWNLEPLQHIQAALSSMNFNAKESKEFIGAQIFTPWKLINIPFAPEYPGDRQWNRDAAQLRFRPNVDQDNLSCPTWNKILEHIGQGLNVAVKESEWCRDCGIVKGSEYLKCWIASLIKEPTEPLPYLFFWGEQNCGKSIFHEAISMLLTKGYMSVDKALENQSGFNGEMENAVLCFIEETNLKKNLVAYNRIKDWVTGKTISIHRKGKTPYLAINCSHFVQAANELHACPIFPGDTRITMVQVHPLPEGKLIPKKQMLILLEKEAPDFVSEIMKLELPISNDRLNIPVLETSDKVTAQQANENELEIFIREFCHYVPGAAISVADFFTRFQEWLDPNAVHLWTKIRMGRAMPSRFPKGRLTTNPQFHFGNISFDAATKPGPVYLSEKDVLRCGYERSIPSGGTNEMP